jgi:hypothetical protein
MGVGWGGAALADSIWAVVPFVVGGAIGNGAAIISNRLFVQRGAPDRYRGRVLATIMSSNSAVLGLSMAAAGALSDIVDARVIWLAAGCLYLFSALLALVMTRWLPLARHAERDALEESSESAVAALTQRSAYPRPRANGAARGGLERIASLLEEIEARRAAESRRSAS